MKFAIVSESTDKTITHAVLVQAACALVKQVATDFASFWETLPCEVDVCDTLAEVPADRCIIHLVDYIPEAPDALAYHTLTPAGRPMLKLGCKTIFDNGGTFSKGANSITSAMSHEILETIGDPYVNFWADYDGTREVALEVADPVEGDAYEIDGIAVTNFVGPRWFCEGGPGPYDKMGTLTSPLTMSAGGYMVLREGGPAGKQTQVYGDAMPQAKREAKALYGRRK